MVKIVETRQRNVADAAETWDLVDQDLRRGTHIQPVPHESTGLEKERGTALGADVGWARVIDTHLRAVGVSVESDDQRSFIEIPLLLDVRSLLLLSTAG